MDLRWHSFLIPGVFLTAIGVALVAARGLDALSIGALVCGFLLDLAAVLRALEER